MLKISGLKHEIEEVKKLSKDLRYLIDLSEVNTEESDEILEKQINEATTDIQKKIRDLELNSTLTEPYDPFDAIVSIQSGAGGVESQDWAEMLLRMYTRWSEKRKYKIQLLDISQGEEAGIKSATIEISGKFAYGYLKAEKGVHRLVRLSPFDAQHQRHTSFAKIEPLPSSKEIIDVEIKPEDIKADFFKSSGPGGQNVQKVSSAVRLTHIPTKIVVSCQNERSQFQNREFAMKILRAKLLELKLEERQKEVANIKGKHIAAEWGSQIRSYILHPYKLCKDHRTGYEDSQPETILEGNIDDFIYASLLKR
jgi:peptide chain release factor 2